MNRVIIGQVIASSGPDREGPGLSREQIHELFEGLRDRGFSAVNHDLTRTPICRTSNLRLEELGSGELAIKADVEVLDEAEFGSMRGFSVGLRGRALKVGTGDACLELLLNPRQFDIEAIARDLEAQFPTALPLKISERIEKGLDPTDAIIILALLGSVEVVG
jgi:hypothetical protein